MARVSASTGRLLAIGHQRHYSILYDNAAETIRRGMIGDISQRMTGEFAKCLEQSIVASGSSANSSQIESTKTASQPVRGVRLGAWAFWRVVVRFFKRLFGRGPA